MRFHSSPVGPGVYRAGLDAALRGAALPYGYTLSVWGSGQVLIDAHGKPGVASVLSFVLAAAAAFGTLKALTRGANALSDPSDLATDSHFLRTVAIQVAAIAGAVGAVALLARIDSGVVWPLGGFAGTAVYLGGTGAALAVREHESRAGA